MWVRAYAILPKIQQAYTPPTDEMAVEPGHVDTPPTESTPTPVSGHVDATPTESTPTPVSGHVDTLSAESTPTPVSGHVDTLSAESTPTSVSGHVDTLSADSVPPTETEPMLVPAAESPPSDLRLDSLVGETDTAWLYGFEQGGDEWKAARKMAVGGSTVAAVLGLSRYSTKDQAEAGLLGSSELRLTPVIIRGSVGESLIRDWVSAQLGLTVREIGIAVRKGMPWMRASPDGIYDLPGGGIGILEIKVVSSRLRRTPFDIAAYQLISGKGMIGMDLIEEHRHQVHYTAGVIGANEITYCVLIWPDDYSGSGRMCVWRFSPDTDLFNNIHVPAARCVYNRACAASDIK